MSPQEWEKLENWLEWTVASTVMAVLGYEIPKGIGGDMKDNYTRQITEGIQRARARDRNR